MTHLATWDDPGVSWDSRLYSWDGEPILSEDTAGTLRQRSVFARIVTHRPFACIEQQRPVACIEQQRLVASITQQRLHVRVADGH